MAVFADASQIAMAACVYITSSSSTKLIMAKSKLPSLKTATTIPKLEMNALTLGARLAHFVHTSLGALMEIHQILFFTDSEIVLGWIQTPPDRQNVGVLVANRLKEIRGIVAELEAHGVQCLFGHVSTKDNPADCGTRGFDSSTCGEQVWWEGPRLIHEDLPLTLPGMFPFATQSDAPEDDEVPAPIAVAAIRKEREKEWDQLTTFDLSRFGTIHKAQRVVAYALRFLRRSLVRLPEERKETIMGTISALKMVSSSHEFSGPELYEARKCIIRDHQRTIVEGRQ
ncbi:hypothetical protein GCK32_022718, partial [Trichostrongylus colubriformis]